MQVLVRWINTVQYILKENIQMTLVEKFFEFVKYISVPVNFGFIFSVL